MIVLWIPTLLAALIAAAPQVTDDVRKITYKGTTAGGVDEFRGIRFAEDTSGSNRFAPPKPYFPKPETVVDATQQGHACPQDKASIATPMSEVPDQSEDCLNLRIARPADADSHSKPLPVMVYIYGGGSILGTAYDMFFNPTGLIQRSVENKEPVIYVAANYRLGVFGFAAAEPLKASKSENVGLRDQYAALEWIKDNIAAFGGDPSRITLFGQSFGGISVGLQLVAYGGERPLLFQKAIMTSGAISVNRNDKPSAKNTLSVAKELGLTDKGVVDDEVLSKLRGVSSEDLNKANLKIAQTVKAPFGFAAFTAVVDGDFIPDQPEDLLTEGRFAKNIPLITTWASDDGSMSADASTSTDDEVLATVKSSIPNYSSETGEKLLSLYPLSDFEDAATAYPGVNPQYFRASRIARDIDPVCPLLTISNQFRRYSPTSGVFVGELNTTRLLPYWDAIGMPWGVSHLSDIPYFFNEAIVAPGDNGEDAMKLSAKYSGSFISFAHSGKPVSEGKVTFHEWPEVGSNGDADMSVLVIGGIHGTGPASIGAKSVESHAMKNELKKRRGNLKTSARIQALEDEKLGERCAFLKSLRVY